MINRGNSAIKLFVFDFREESDIYDKLAVSLEGDLLTDFNTARLGSKTSSQGKCRIQIATTLSRGGHDSEFRIWENLYLELD